MRKALVLLFPILLTSCITINKEEKPDVGIQKTPLPGIGVPMKPSTESESFVDPTDGLTYKWVKVRVTPYSDVPLCGHVGDVLQPASVASMRVKPITGSFKDERDGQVYKTVTLGKQTWMAQNLNYKTPQSLNYNNDPKNGPIYGMLYNYGGLSLDCPKGWHVPTDAEWEELEYNAGMSKDDTAKDMYRGNIAANFMSGGATKMNIVFGGFWGQGRYKGEGGEANYWTSTLDKDNHVASRLFRMGDSRICKNRVGLAHLFSIRCVKDAGVIVKKQ